jgi:hypothetical protein
MNQDSKITKISERQTAIPCPDNQHDYSRGLDHTLQVQQLRDCLKVIGTVRLGKPRSGMTKTEAPLFDPPKAEQGNLF